MNLKPTKHSHPDRTVINVSVLILSRLKSRRIESYDDLSLYIKEAVIGGSILLLPALNFLYLMGLIEYHPKNDTLEFVGLNEAV